MPVSSTSTAVNSHQRPSFGIFNTRRTIVRESGKRNRRELAVEYTRRYTAEILDHADLTTIAESLPTGITAALLCVERDPEACHRSLIAQRFAEEHGLSIQHLRP